MPLTTYVIGSGPAGVACARALADRGNDVTIIDAGIELEPAREQLVDRMAGTLSEKWDARSVAMLTGKTQSNFGGVPLKLAYGSDFPYRPSSQGNPIEAHRVTSFASLAKGGLSNVWGAAVLPYRAGDILDWPVTLDELAPAYRSIFEFVPLAARQDDLERIFPLYAQKYHPLRFSEQARSLLDRMESNRKSLEREGFTFGGSRLAVRANGPSACVYCGLCMYGCPYRLIYKSTESIGTVRYVGNTVVDRVAESGSTVTLYGRDLRNNSAIRLEGERVFVGCGAFQTARIMLKSLEARDHVLTLRDSQYFLLPVLGLRSAGKVATERLHTLSQLFIEVSDNRVSSYPSHLQVYTYNDLYSKAIKDKLKAFPWLADRLSGIAVGRVMAIQGYLHSNASSTASIRLNGEKLMVTGNGDGQSAKRVAALVKKLSRNARALGFLPISPLVKIGYPGQGAHVGGTFPMRAHPGPFESDRLGRPHGFSRVHLIDASVLPSIPATTITLTVMANAYRIGSESYDN